MFSRERLGSRRPGGRTENYLGYIADLIERSRVVLPIVHVHPQRAQMEAELAAFERQKQELIARYAGRYVAVHAGKVIDDDSDKIELATRIDEQFPNDVVLIKQVKAEPDQLEITLHGPAHELWLD